MKLKKIASLMLAGIMAVSMLAACGNANSNGGNGGNGEGDGTQTSGYSAVMADHLKDSLKDKDYISFADNAQDEAALKAALNYLGSAPIEVAAGRTNPESIENYEKNGWDEFKDTILKGIDSTGYYLKESQLDMQWWTTDNGGARNKDQKVGAVYIMNGNVGLNESVKMVAAKVERELKNLAETGKVNGSAGTGVVEEYDYTYVVSVSVANKTIGDNTANFVLVTVDRTVTNK